MSDLLLSMTGYGEATVIAGDKEWRIVIQSVNSRYLDCRCRLPHTLHSLEPQFRSAVKKFVERGKVDIVLTSSVVDSTESEVDSSSTYFNNSFIAGYCMAGVALVDSLGWSVNDQMHSSLLQSALARREAFDAPSENIEEVSDILDTLLMEALKSHLESRKKEGLYLAADFRRRISIIAELLSEVEKHAVEMPEIFKDRIEQRLTLILSDTHVHLDETRLCQEVAYLIDKADISEEIVRLRAHLEQFIHEIESLSTNRKGKKFEFVVQEMLREINTIGSKANLLEITRNVVDMKNELEKIREQVQNVI